MRKLIVSELVTLDGVMQAPGGKDEAEPGKNIATDGSGQLVHEVVREESVDELHLLLYPLSLGSGKRLLPEGVHTTFSLMSATPYPSGVVGLLYERQR